MVFDPRPENPLVIVGSDFFLTVIGNTLSKKSSNVVRFYSVDCCPDDLIIKGFQITWLFKHDIRSTLNLLNCPCIIKPEVFHNRAVSFGKDIQDFMKVFRIDPVRELLGGFNIGDFEEGVIVHAEINVLLLQLTGKKVMPIHIELQTERRPGRDTQIAQAKFFINEIKVIMETFALVKFEECLTSCFIMPWFISIALFHGRKDVN